MGPVRGDIKSFEGGALAYNERNGILGPSDVVEYEGLERWKPEWKILDRSTMSRHVNTVDVGSTQRSLDKG